MINPFAKFQTRSQVIPSSNPLPFVITDGRIVPNNMIDGTAALMNSDIFAVINRISSDVAACEFRSKEPVLTLLNQPSKLISGFNFWQTIVTQLLLAGNAYAVITWEQGVAKSLEFIPVAQVQVILTDYSKDLSYTVDFGDERGTRTLPSADMLHFRLMSIGENGTQYIGMSPLESLASDIQIADYSRRLTLAQLKQGLAPTYSLKVPQGILDAEAKENIRSEFEAANSGDNAGRAIVLDQGLELNSLSINADVAKFLNNMDFSKTQIAKAFCIPDSYLNGQGDQQSSIDMMRGLYANSLQIYIKPIESECQLKLKLPVELNEAPAIDVDHQQLIDNITKLAAGKTPVISAEKAADVLQRKGVFD